MFGGTPTGNEPYHDRCKQLLTELGLDGAATFEGRVASVVEAYHAGHVVLLTSISEGFPYTLIEAMAAGRPTVATDVGGVNEATGDAALVVPPRDHHAIAAASVRLLRDAQLRRTLGEAARARILSLFTVEQSMALFGDVYREVTGRPASAIVVDQQHHPCNSGPGIVAPERDVCPGDPVTLDSLGIGRPLGGLVGALVAP
jgi:polysaccharide biosynthesis protein PelF